MSIVEHPELRLEEHLEERKILGEDENVALMPGKIICADKPILLTTEKNYP
jgi:hypothetical protein